MWVDCDVVGVVGLMLNGVDVGDYVVVELFVVGLCGGSSYYGDGGGCG